MSGLFGSSSPLNNVAQQSMGIGASGTANLSPQAAYAALLTLAKGPNNTNTLGAFDPLTGNPIDPVTGLPVANKEAKAEELWDYGTSGDTGDGSSDMSGEAADNASANSSEDGSPGSGSDSGDADSGGGDYARGGLVAFANGGRVIPLAGGGKIASGLGGGLDDLIPTTIDGRQAASLSDGEFVIPSDVVSMMGDGSTNAGSRRLYDMVRQIREAKTGRPTQPAPLDVHNILDRAAR